MYLPSIAKAQLWNIAQKRVLHPEDRRKLGCKFPFSIPGIMLSSAKLMLGLIEMRSYITMLCFLEITQCYTCLVPQRNQYRGPTIWLI